MKIKNKKFDLSKYIKRDSYNLNKVVGIDPSNFNDIYFLDNGVLSKISEKEIKKEYLLATFIPNKNIINYELSIPKNRLDKIDLDSYIETECYKEVGLDDTEEYLFKYKMIYSYEDEKNVLAEVVIVPKNEGITTYFQDLLNKYYFIDYIGYSGYLFEVLYEDGILEPKKDMFIYFTEKAVVITFFSEGRFLHTFSIPEGLEIIYKKLMESNIKVSNLDYQLFLKLITKKGLESKNYSNREGIIFNELSEHFSNLFLLISNQLHSIKRKFGLPAIDRIFMSTVKGVIPGSSEFANMYLGVEANDLKFDKKYNPNNIEIEQMLFLTILSASSSYSRKDFQNNFTLKQRPPTFFFRYSGQFITASVTAVFLSSLYPLYQTTATYLINAEKVEQNSVLNNLNNEYSKLKKTNNLLKSKLKAVRKKKEETINFIKGVQSIIETIYRAKKGYIPKSIFLTEVVKFLHYNRVYVLNAVLNQNELILFVKSNREDRITNFINDLVQKEKLIVDTKGILREKNFYTSQIIIKVGL